MLTALIFAVLQIKQNDNETSQIFIIVFNPTSPFWLSSPRGLSSMEEQQSLIARNSLEQKHAEACCHDNWFRKLIISGPSASKIY